MGGWRTRGIGAEDDWRAASVLTSSATRFAIVVPVIGSLAYAGAAAPVADGSLFVGLAAVIVVLAVVPLIRPWLPIAAETDAAPRFDVVWQVLSVVGGTTAGSALLVYASDIEVEPFAALFALLLVVGAYAFPRPLRPFLLAWTVVVWLATMWLGGVDELEVLMLHLGGAVLTIAATTRSSTVLSRSLVAEERSRRAAEQHARLLSSVARTNTLDPDQVLRATVDGLLEVGFASAAVRELDHERRVARLVEGAARFDLKLAEELGFDDGDFGQVARSGQPAVLRSAKTDPRNHLALPLRDLLTLPLLDGGVVRATVTAGTADAPVTEEMLDAARFLAEQASDALVRARAYREDHRTVGELQWLDVRTQDFISTASHELRTPLTVVQGLGQTLLDHWQELDADRRRDLLDRIESNAERLATMVRSLLDTSAVESGALQPSTVPVSVRPTVTALIHRLSGVLVDHPVTVTVEPDLTVEVDPGLFEHVLENLLANAVKHTPPGTTVHVVGRRQHERAIVSVRDDGPGIAPDDLPHVLDRFYRGGDPTRREAGGLGLGLALAREVVEAHGGQLGVVSRRGEDTTFSFDLPLAVAPSPSDASPETVPASRSVSSAEPSPSGSWSSGSGSVEPR